MSRWELGRQRREEDVERWGDTDDGQGTYTTHRKEQSEWVERERERDR